MKKGILSLALVVFMLFTFNIGVYAQNTIQPRYSYTSSIGSRLAVQSQHAVCSGVITGNSGVTKITAKITLQKRGVLKWNDVTTWTNTVNGNILNLEYRYGPIDSGKYRVVIEATVYAGSSSENVSKTSSVVTV